MARVLVILLGIAVGCSGKGDGEGGPSAQAHRSPQKSPADPGVPSSSRPAPPAPAGTPFVDLGITSIAIYYAPDPTGDPGKILRGAIARQHPTWRIGSPDDKVPPAPAVIVGEPPVAEVRPPDVSLLEYVGRGLSDGQAAAVQKSSRVLATTFVAAGADRLGVLHDAMTTMLDVARRTDGLLWDENTRELYSVEAWRTRLETWRSTKRASSLFTVHIYRHGELFRMVSLGLARFGLPDLVVNQVAASSTESMGSLISATAQTLLDGGQVGEGGRLAIDLEAIPGDWNVMGGGSKKGVVALTIAEPGEGDADNRLWELSFPGPPDELQARHQQLIDQIFGGTDQIIMADDDDVELLAASKRARARLFTELKPSFAAGTPEMGHLLVKAPFKTDGGGQEWMWIEVTAWQGKNIKGVLQSAPGDIRGLSPGDRVETSEDVVFDYIHRRADGSEDGNTTSELLLRRQDTGRPESKSASPAPAR